MIFISRRQVGYTVARIATDLRLELLRAMMAAKWEYFLRERLGSHTQRHAKRNQAVLGSAFNLGVLMVADFLEALVYIVTAFLVSANASLAAIGLSLFIMFFSSALHP